MIDPANFALRVPSSAFPRTFPDETFSRTPIPN